MTSKLISVNNWTECIRSAAVRKPVVRETESFEAVLIFDDTIQEKLYSKENGLIAWHFNKSPYHSAMVRAEV